MTSQVSPADRARQMSVSAAEVFCIFGTLLGTGVLGTRVQESSGGALAADATHIAPAGPAFSIWSVIYLGLFAYTVWQWLPSQASQQRHRAIGWLVAASMVLNASWLLVTQVGWIAISVVVILLLLASLIALMMRLRAISPTSAADRVVTDLTFGLYLGWVCVAVCANIAAALAAGGVQVAPPLADWLAVAVVAVASAVGIALGHWSRGRVAIAAAMAWGLAWITVGRITDEPQSMPTAIAAGVGAVAILATTAARRLSSDVRT
ncbi:tryptophan-rich sensory protein [Gephyromycinifex aptenodytis]|uniref:tryptophan-rich sensory protein n=1 Tax=Gephyromycinifex aptenodytis TaxID=2716227 RepID=UPI001447F903|nr:tryptophan-rich sensory protein [Gephyromycinifex aptenodytis]